MIKIFIITSLLFSISCKKEYAKYKRNPKNNVVTIIPKNVGLDSVKVIKWPVGPLFKQKVSKGFLLGIKFPQLEEKHFKDLIADSKIDSWLIKIVRNTNFKREKIGHAYIPLYTSTKRAKKTYNYRQAKKGFLKILYYAATPSKRFETFQCPAFNHNYVIKDIDIVQTTRPLKKIVVSPSYDQVITQKVLPFSLSPVIISGGTTLKGKYIIDIALYDSKHKMVRSSSLKLNQIVKVGRDSRKHISGCAGFKPPPRPKKSKKKFRWNRKQ